MRLLLTRPLQDAEPLAAELARAGHRVRLCPLLEIRFADAAPLDLDGVQAILLTSANGARALAGRLPAAAQVPPVLAVGAATAAAARRLGCTRVESADGDVVALAELAAARCDPARGALLHVAGSRVAGDLAGRLGARGFTVRRAVLYDAVAARALPPDCRAALAEGGVDAALFYSPRSAATFVKLVTAAGLAAACRGVEALCLSPAVAEALGGVEWRRLRVARRPEQAALLALLEEREGA